MFHIINKLNKNGGLFLKETPFLAKKEKYPPKRKIFFTVEDFSLCCLRISEFLMKAGTPLINQCISHIKIFTQEYERLNQKIIIFVPL